MRWRLQWPAVRLKGRRVHVARVGSGATPIFLRFFFVRGARWGWPALCVLEKRERFLETWLEELKVFWSTRAHAWRMLLVFIFCVSNYKTLSEV